MKEIIIGDTSEKHPIEDYYLQVQYLIKSNVLRIFVEQYNSSHLKKIYNEEDKTFKFFVTFEGKELIPYASTNILEVKAKINLDNINNNSIDTVLNQFRKVILNGLKIYADNGRFIEDFFQLDFEGIMKEAMIKMLDYIMEDTSISKFMIFNDLTNIAIDEIKMDKFQLYSKTSNVEVNKEMESEESTKKALDLAKRQYEKYKDNPIIKQRFEKDIKRLEKHLQNFKIK